MSQIIFDHGIVDPPAGASIVNFHDWLAGTAPKYQRRLCSCGCQEKQTPNCEDDSLPSGF